MNFLFRHGIIWGFNVNNFNLKIVSYVLVGCSICLFFLIAWLKDITAYSLSEILALGSQVATVEFIFILIFSKYLWKHKIFKSWIVLCPDLNGTWKGNIHTNWIDPKTGKKPCPIPAILTIRQSLFNISCVMRTAEMNSYSMSGSFILDKSNQIKKLLYTYDSVPFQTIKDRSSEHRGTVLFEIIEKPDLKLHGEYWTGRETSGQIEMYYWKKELLECYPTELGAHPVSEARRNRS